MTDSIVLYIFQLIGSVIVLGVNFIIAVVALIVLHRRDRYRHLLDVKGQAGREDSCSSEGDSETDRMLKASGQGEAFWDCSWH